MALTDFLTSGQQAITTPTSSMTQRTLPDWYTNYAMELLSNQGAVSNTPYATYQGPRIAEMTPLQQQGIEQTQQAAGAYRPLLDAAGAAATGAVGSSAYGETKPYLGMAAQTAPSVVGQYMNPYTENVVNRIGELGARTLNEQILPGIRDKFIAGGTYGGSRNAELFGRGVRDAMEGISAEQAKALESGYQGSLGAAQTDLGRFGTLGTIAGQTAGQDIEAERLGAGTLASLAEQTQKQGLTGAGALMTAGGAQQGQTQANLDLAYQDFLKQQGYPQAQIDQSVGTLKGVAQAVPWAESREGAEAGGTFTPSNFQTALAGMNLGADAVSKIYNVVRGLR
jgi:hypothetical protein